MPAGLFTVQSGMCERFVGQSEPEFASLNPSSQKQLSNTLTAATADWKVAGAAITDGVHSCNIDSQLSLIVSWLEECEASGGGVECTRRIAAVSNHTLHFLRTAVL